MNKKLRKIAIIVLAAVFAVSTALMLRQWMDNAGGKTAYEDAVAVAMQKPAGKRPEETKPAAPANTQENAQPVPVWVPAAVADDPKLEEIAEINIAALREVNPDVVGWIRIPDTEIDYPLMQGEDNDFYLNHTWKKEPNSVGSIFLEHQNSADLTDYNTIVYGHNMNNGSMFADLELFALERHWREHPYVYVATDAGVYRYEIFAFFQAEVDSLTYGLNPRQDDTKEYFLELSARSAAYDTGIKPALTDRILTLSTCSGADYAYRYVVQARLPMVETFK